MLAQLLRYRVVLVSFANELKGETSANAKANVEGQIEELFVTVGENIVTVEHRIFRQEERGLNYDRTFHIDINRTTLPSASIF